MSIVLLYDIVYPIYSKLRNHTHLCPLFYSYDIVYPIYSRLRNHRQLCPLFYSYDIVYPIHSRLRNHTQLCLVQLFYSLLYMLLGELCNTVIIYIEEHRIISFIMINIHEVAYNNINRLITWLQYVSWQRTNYYIFSSICKGSDWHWWGNHLQATPIHNPTNTYIQNYIHINGSFVLTQLSNRTYYHNIQYNQPQ
jgi:hypothetical protein